MSWLTQPATDLEDWNALPLDLLLAAMPQAPFPSDEQMLDEENHVLPDWMEWRLTYYRFATAGLFRVLGEMPDSPCGGVCATFARLMVVAPPGERFDWKACWRAADAAWRASWVEPGVEAGSLALHLPTCLLTFPTTAGLREFVEWVERVDAASEGRPTDAEWDAMCRRDDRFADVIRTVLGYPWRPALDPQWKTADVMALARGIWVERAWDRTPILADALQDAGCTLDDMLAHLRDATVDRTDGDWAVIDVLLPAPPG